MKFDMSRFDADVSRFSGQNNRDGTRARDRESGRLSRPVSRPVSTLSRVPFCFSRFIKRIAFGWPVRLAWWVLRYELAEGAKEAA